VERSELALLRSLICLDELAVPSHSKLLQPWHCQTVFFSSSYHPVPMKKVHFLSFYFVLIHLVIRSEHNLGFFSEGVVPKWIYDPD
jgi:hypothetical protein